MPVQFFTDLRVDCRLQRFDLVGLNQSPGYVSSPVDAGRGFSLARNQAAPICQLGLEYLLASVSQ